MDGGEKSRLASELTRLLAMARELEAQMDRGLPVPPAARELCAAVASAVDRSICIARSSPSASGSPRSDPAAGGKDAQFKRRKGMPSVRKQVQVTSAKDMAALDDGLSWRKYGQKDILGAKHPRAYFRCTYRHTQGCLATKQVQRADGDPALYDVVYHGAHACAQAARPSAAQLRRQMQAGHGGAQEHQRSTPSPDTEGVQAGLEPVTPSPFASTLAGGGSFQILSPASLERQLRSSHAADDLGVGMDSELRFQEFFSTPADSFPWEFYDDLYAAN